MKKLLLATAVAALVMTCPSPHADAKVGAVYVSGMGGVQNAGKQDPGLGVMAGARLLIFDGYLDYTGFGGGQSISRGILGLRGGFGTPAMRLVLRGGVGGIHEENGALTGPTGGASRSGGVARLGAAIEGAVSPLFWLGFGIDGESYRFANDVPYAPTQGSDVFATLRLTFELGV